MPINKKRIIFRTIFFVIFIALFTAVFIFGFFEGKQSVICKACRPETLDFSLFWEAYNTLKQNFINPEKIDDQKIIYGAIEGMAKTLDDPYTAFFNPAEAKKFEQDLKGSFDGIGVEIGIKKNQLTIVAPLKDTPGQKAGLKAGDAILRIDGKDTADMTTDEAVNLIRGQKGTDVTLTIYRDGWNKSKDIKITRDTIVIPSMEWEIKNGDVAYVHIHQFGATLPADFKKAVIEILSSQAKKIVLDLRNNPGGYLDASQDIAGWFLEKGKVVTIESFGKNKEQVIYKSEGSGNFADYPVVVLINEGTASASEILAGALRDNRGIKLIGQKSFGKGSVQEMIDLYGGSFLKITIAKWLTPNGVSISDFGLTPDIAVEITDNDLASEKDPQLDKALEIVRSIP